MELGRKRWKVGLIEGADADKQGVTEAESET